MTPIDWTAAEEALDSQGYARLPGLLAPADCAALIPTWDYRERFRSEVVMARHGYGRGAYRYFDHPLPDRVADLRRTLYPPLAAIANDWAEALGTGLIYPPDHEAFLARCREAGQTRPTPLLLRYGTGDYNALHQDLYGEHVFPLQVAIKAAHSAGASSAGSMAYPCASSASSAAVQSITVMVLP